MVMRDEEVAGWAVVVLRGSGCGFGRVGVEEVVFVGW